MLCQCTCPTQFPMVRVGNNGKYKVGDKLIIFVRILRRHIMVRVGGGWQELSEFLRVKDPCRSRAFQQQPLQQVQQQHHNSPQQNSSQNSTKLSSPSSMILRSRLIESNQHLNSRTHSHQNNSSHRHHNHTHHYRNIGAGGQRLISGSASMSWLSHNS